MKPNKKKIIIFALLALLVLGLAVWLVIFINKKPNQEGTSDGQNLFPFGEILAGIGLGGDANQGTDGENGDTQEDIGISTEDIGPQLRLINAEPTGGMVALTRIEEKEISTAGTDAEGNPTVTTETIEVENSFVRFSEIKDGSVYETRMTGENFYGEEMIVENYLPNAEYAYFSPYGNKVAYQYWAKNTRTIETYLGTITEPTLSITACPFDISGAVVYEQESTTTYNVHRLLNLRSETQVATTGVNSPGNESALASDLTKNAIVQFQNLRGLTPDGSFGSKTRWEMITYCNEYQKELALQEVAKDTKARYQISGQFLPQNIVSLAMDPKGEGVFYLAKDTNGVVGNFKKWSESSARKVFNSPFSEWTSVWNNPDYLELQTKPSYLAYGFSYNLEVSSGDYHKSFQQKLGLTTLPSPDNKKVLIYSVDSGSPKLSLFDRATGIAAPLLLQTFTDKCAWSQDSLFLYCAVPDSLPQGVAYPDTWYQGLETYQDSLFRLNTTNFAEELLTNIPTDYGETIDVERIIVDSQDQYLYFIDKQTESLWSYRLVK